MSIFQFFATNCKLFEESFNCSREISIFLTKTSIFCEKLRIFQQKPHLFLEKSNFFLFFRKNPTNFMIFEHKKVEWVNINLPHHCNYHNSNESTWNHLWQNTIYHVWRVLEFPMAQFAVDHVSFFRIFFFLCICFVYYLDENKNVQREKMLEFCESNLWCASSNRFCACVFFYIKFPYQKKHERKKTFFLFAMIYRNFWLEIVQKSEVHIYWFSTFC